MFERRIGRAALLVTGTVCAMGCATQRELIDRSASAGVSRCSFWPPPRSTSLALAPNPLPAQASGLASAARRIASELDACAKSAAASPRSISCLLDRSHRLTARLERNRSHLERRHSHGRSWAREPEKLAQRDGPEGSVGLQARRVCVRV